MKEVDLLFKYIKTLQVKPGEKVDLKKNYDTDYDHTILELDKGEGEALLQEGITRLADLQDKLYASGKRSVLIIFQAMDAAGKDGAIKHIMKGLNPQGVRVTSFKTPSKNELAHDYLWRHYIALPAGGEIGIFNRSHYENVLVTRVHPEFILAENIPGINSIKMIDQNFWNSRFDQIKNFEKTISDSGTLVLKFFLHVSRKEQKKRFIERIDNASKNWKFSVGDIKERSYWKEYRNAYEDMLGNTSTADSPWFVIPADDKWFTRLSIAAIIYKQFEKLNLNYPTVSNEQKEELLKAKETLMNEKE